MKKLLLFILFILVGWEVFWALMGVKSLYPWQLQEKMAQFGAEPTLTTEWITYIKAYARVVPATETVSGICRDPDDDMFLTAALSGGASYIISGDRDLQVLGEYQGVKVLSPREFAELLGIVAPLASDDA